MSSEDKNNLQYRFENDKGVFKLFIDKNLSLLDLIQDIKLKIHYEYEWSASWFISPFIKFVEMKELLDDKDKYRIWYYDVDSYVKNNQLIGFTVTYSPVIKILDSNIELKKIEYKHI